MSLGNGNAKASNKGSNYSKELKQIKLLNLIEDGINGIGLPPSVLGLAKESTLQALLAAVDAQRDYEVRIVNDSNPGGEVTFLEVRYWDTQDGTLAAPVYYLPGDNTAYEVGDPGGPVAPLSYVPTSTLLTQILAELVGVNTELDAIKLDTANLDVALSTRATEATLTLLKGILDNIKLDTAAIDTNTDNLEALLTTIDAVIDQIQTNTLNTVNELTTANVKLNDIEGELIDQGNTLDVVETEVISIDDRLTAKVITPNIVRATGAGTIASAVYSFSVANVGAGNGTILGQTIKPTETLNFDAGSLNNTYAAGTIAYDGTGTELLITYNS